MSEPSFAVVWPKSPRGVQTHRLASRLENLSGARIAFLWDHVFRGDEVLPELAAALHERIDGLEILDHDVFGNTHGSDEREMVALLPDALARRHVDAVVSAMGC